LSAIGLVVHCSPKKKILKKSVLLKGQLRVSKIRNIQKQAIQVVFLGAEFEVNTCSRNSNFQDA
jgi:hypothetical protein